MTKKIAVIGLGVLGRNLARFLTENGAEVIAIDSSMENIEEIKDRVAVAVCMDATSERALIAQEMHTIDTAIVCIGENFESNILATVLLKKLGVKKVIARASKEVEFQILTEIGADEIINPEKDIAKEMALRLTASSVLDLIPLNSALQAVTMLAPPLFHGKSLSELALRNRHGINIIAIYESEDIEKTCDPFPTPNTIIRKGNVLLLVGKNDDVKKLSQL
jgi:trk system potassium uptake protein